MPDSTGSPEFSNSSGLIDRRVLQAERDAARAERRLLLAQQETADALRLVAELRAELADQAQRVVLLREQIETIYASASWRISRPVRVMSGLAQRLRAGMSGEAPQAEPVTETAAPAETNDTLGARERAILRRLQGRA
jgi:hypothetical protein